MKTPDANIREELWNHISVQFAMAVRTVIESRKPAPAKIATLNGIVKTAYQAGVDRGFDLGYHVFGDGTD